MKCLACGGTGEVELPVDLARRLRLLRQEAGLSQRTAAQRLKISAQFLCDMEAGKRRWTVARRKALEKMCRAG